MMSLVCTPCFVVRISFSPYIIHRIVLLITRTLCMVILTVFRSPLIYLRHEIIHYSLTTIH